MASTTPSGSLALRSLCASPPPRLSRKPSTPLGGASGESSGLTGGEHCSHALQSGHWRFLTQHPESAAKRHNTDCAWLSFVLVIVRLACVVAHKLSLWSPGGGHQGFLPRPPPLPLLHPPHATLPPLYKHQNLVTGRQ